jgi:hypothetical protein
MSELQPDKLLVVWTGADREVALNMVLMYAHNAQRHRWWGQVTLLIWGPSQSLVLRDAEVRGKLAEMQDAGVRLIACRSCADNYGIADGLSELGIEVFGTGPTLTDWLKSECKVITF